MDFDILLNCSNEDLFNLVLYSFFDKKTERSNKVTFSLSEITDDESWLLFRFRKEGLVRLFNSMQLPEYLYGLNGIKFTSFEGLCILLRRLAYPNRLFDLSKIFRRTRTELSLIINSTLNYIYEKFGPLLTNLDHPILAENRIQEYCLSVVNNNSPLTNCWGFIDGTLRPCCRPTINQKELFSGHKRTHGIKFQAVVIPSGIIAHLYGPVAGRRHDCYMLNKSEILNQMEVKMNTADGQPYCIYGDGAYPIRSHLLASFKGANLTADQRRFNRTMSNSRVCVEWEFGKMISLFAFLDFKKNLKLYLQPIAKYYMVATILNNCHTCIYGSETSMYFNFNPPTLEEYLQVQI